MSIVDIRKFSLSFEMTEPAFNGVKGTIPILQNLNFTQVNHVLIKEGSFTPANDYLYLAQNIPANQAPNFIFIMSPLPLNISIIAQGQMMCNAIPVNKFFMLALPTDGGYKIDNIFIEGRTNVLAPMAQGVSIDYWAVMAQATF